MFCTNCGKQIADNVRFCKFCGTNQESHVPLSSVNNQNVAPQTNGYQGAPNVNVYSNAPMGQSYQQQMAQQPYASAGLAAIFPGMDTNRLGIFIVMIAITIYVALGGFRPVIEVGSFGYDRCFSIWDMEDLSDLLREVGSGESGVVIARFVLGCALLGSVVSTICGIVFVWKLISGERGEYLTVFAKYAMVSQTIAMLIMLFVTMLVNKSAEEYTYGVDLVSLSMEGIFLLILPLVNLFWVIRTYEGQSIVVSDYTDRSAEKICVGCGTNYCVGIKCPKCGSRGYIEGQVYDKVCMVCKTSYSIGNKCPKCGSKSTQ